MGDRAGGRPPTHRRNISGVGGGSATPSRAVAKHFRGWRKVGDTPPRSREHSRGWFGGQRVPDLRSEAGRRRSSAQWRTFTGSSVGAGRVGGCPKSPKSGEIAGKATLPEIADIAEIADSPGRGRARTMSRNIPWPGGRWRSSTHPRTFLGFGGGSVSRRSRQHLRNRRNRRNRRKVAITVIQIAEIAGSQGRGRSRNLSRNIPGSGKGLGLVGS